MEEQRNVYRKMLTVAISSILIETGFDTVDKDVLGTLTEMLQCCKSIYLEFVKLYQFSIVAIFSSVRNWFSKQELL